MQSKLFTFIFTLISATCFLVVANTAQAAMSYGSGYYTNLNGSGYSADIHTGSACNPSTGSCSGAYVLRSVCDGRTTNCDGQHTVPTLVESGTNLSLGYPGCGKTVQLDVFNQSCRDGSGNWICGVPADYMVWYTGDCAYTAPAPVVQSAPQMVNVCGKTLSQDQLNSELRGAGYPGPWDLNSSIAAYQRAACPVVQVVATPTPIQSGPTPTPIVITPTPAPIGGTTIRTPVECPNGTNPTIYNSTIVCVSNTAVASTGPINVVNSNTNTINTPPQVVLAAAPQVVYTDQKQPVQQLPKTGLPLGAWSLTGMLPIGLGLRKFTSMKYLAEVTPNYIWQLKEFAKKEVA